MQAQTERVNLFTQPILLAIALMSQTILFSTAYGKLMSQTILFSTAYGKLMSQAISLLIAEVKLLIARVEIPTKAIAFPCKLLLQTISLGRCFPPRHHQLSLKP
jgi:hypothetical protein